MVKYKDPLSSSEKSRQNRKQASPPAGKPEELLINYENRAQFEINLKAGETVKIMVEGRAL